MKIDVLPGGRENNIKHQATLEIANIGGTATRATYRYRLKGKRGQVLKSGVIEDMPRKELLAVDLVTIVLTDARGEKIMKKLK